ncbi:hypothetical protein EON63_22345 [archaeon]|nr:MAG: hypothetical protein EON63_22345 [archaeon]
MHSHTTHNTLHPYLGCSGLKGGSMCFDSSASQSRDLKKTCDLMFCTPFTPLPRRVFGLTSRSLLRWKLRRKM